MLSACTDASTDAEDELRTWVEEAEEAAEQKDRRALLDKISTSYVDARGNDRDRLSDVLRALMLRQRSVSLLTTIDALELHGDTAAEVALTVAMAGKGAAALDLRADAYRFELELEKAGDDWQLIGARWGQIGTEVR